MPPTPFLNFIRFLLLALLLGAAPARAGEATDLAQKVHGHPDARALPRWAAWC